MTRTRRVSIELVRREFRLSITRRAAAAAEASPDAPARDETDAPASDPLPGECSACGSSWFPLPAGGGAEPALVQRALEKHGIHTLLSLAGELFVCARSFELQVGAFDAGDSVSAKPPVPGHAPSGEGRS